MLEPAHREGHPEDLENAADPRPRGFPVLVGSRIEQHVHRDPREHDCAESEEDDQAKIGVEELQRVAACALVRNAHIAIEHSKERSTSMTATSLTRTEAGSSLAATFPRKRA